LKISIYLFATIVSGLLLNSCNAPKKAVKSETSLATDTIPMSEITIYANPQYKGFDTKYFKLIHTDLDLKPSWHQHYLYGKAVIELTPFAYHQDTLALDALGFIIKKVEIKPELADSKPNLANYRYNNKKLYISLGKTFQPGDILTVYIDYIACPDSVMSKQLKPKDELKGLFFINPDNKDSLEPRELWTQGETQSNSCWFPTIDAPNQKMTQKIKITIDSQYVTLSNGKLTSSVKNGDGTRSDIWEQKLPHAPYLTMIAAGPWVIVHDNWRKTVPVDYYVDKGYAPYAKMNFGHTPEMIEYFSKILNYPFVWDKYDQIVCRDYEGGAMENTGAVVFFERMNQDRHSHMDEDLEDVVSHELFHHWFGDLVTCESWSNIALNESFATFGEYLWRDYKYGTQERGYYCSEDLKKYLEEANYHLQPVIYHYYNDQEDLFDRTRYQKGGLVLVMLRHYLGDKVFFAALHNYLTDYSFKTAEIANLRLAFENASGEDLHWYFTEWFDKPGHPVFEVNHTYNSTSNTLTLNIKQTQTDEKVPVFRMPVDLDIYMPDNTVMHKKVWVANRSDTFTFSLAAKPFLVNFDASKTLVCQKKVYNSSGEWYYQYFHAPLVVDRLEALIALTRINVPGGDSLGNVINSALKDSFWAVRETSLQAINKSTQQDIYAQYKSIIHTMAEKDARSGIRALAITIIRMNEKEEAIALYEKELDDSSYLVISTALGALQKSMPEKDSDLLLSFAVRYENMVHSDAIMLEIAKIYSQYGDASKLPFIHKVFYYISSYEFYDYLNCYEVFIKRNSWHLLESDLYFINHIGDKLDNYMDKLGYKEILHKLSEEMQSIKSVTQNQSDIQRLDKIIDSLQKRRDSIKFKEER